MLEELAGGIKGATDRALKYGNLQYKLFCALLDKLGYSNHQLQDLEVRNKVYRYLKKNYSKFLEGCNYAQKDSGAESNDVWVCWLQGMENAPDIVKACCRSVRKWLPDREIHVIDQSNLFEYVKLPGHVIEKWKKGILSNTLFSDFIRLSLLTQFGGIWVDATVFMTGGLPEYIKNSGFFVFQSNEYDIAKAGESWFIKANANNRILQVTLDLMNEYWRRENKTRDYFIMFIFMRMAKDKYPQDMEHMYRISVAIPVLMQKYISKKYDLEIYNYLCKISSVHKLTYKMDENITEDSLYQKLL